MDGFLGGCLVGSTGMLILISIFFCVILPSRPKQQEPEDPAEYWRKGRRLDEDIYD